MTERMTEGQFLEALDTFALQLEGYVANLRETEHLDLFRERTALAIHRLIRHYRNLVERTYVESRPIPLEGWASVEWRDAYVKLTAWMNTGFSSEIGRVVKLAEVQAQAEMARWLESLERTGESNLLGVHLPQRIA